jgi:hypothetical protein
MRASSATSPSLTSLPEKLIEFGAEVVSDGRYVTYQMAEVAVSRQMFRDILSLIARPRAPSAGMNRRSGQMRRRQPRYAQRGQSSTSQRLGPVNYRGGRLLHTRRAIYLVEGARRTDHGPITTGNPGNVG